MVVEDEPDIYEVLLAMFEMWGIEGVAFVDGEESVDWIDDVDNGRFKGELPELALLDVRLPGDIDGVQVAERLRESPVLGKIAIVLTSGYKLPPAEKDEAMKSTQADLWLPKPLPKFNELQGTLESVIAKRRQQNAVSAVVRQSDAKKSATATGPNGVTKSAETKKSTGKGGASNGKKSLKNESDTPVS